jgi:hypothetical protein
MLVCFVTACTKKKKKKKEKEEKQLKKKLTEHSLKANGQDSGTKNNIEWI